MNSKPTTRSNPIRTPMTKMMMMVVVVVLAIVVLICSNSRVEALPNPNAPPQLPEEWHAWKALHDKSYKSQREELSKHVVWKANKKFIEAHNALNQTFGYILEVNQFSDMVSSNAKHSTLRLSYINFLLLTQLYELHS